MVIILITHGVILPTVTDIILIPGTVHIIMIIITRRITDIMTMDIGQDADPQVSTEIIIHQIVQAEEEIFTPLEEFQTDLIQQGTDPETSTIILVQENQEVMLPRIPAHLR